MIDSIQTFGDSFLYGSELSDCKDFEFGVGYSQLTWPALAAKKLKLDYNCWAEGGSGNQSIAFKVFRYARPGALNIINWSWIDRFDHNFTRVGWPKTIRPDNSELATFYYKNIHSEYDDKVRNLTIAYSVLSYLKNNNMPFIMTYMDHLMVDDASSISHIRDEIVDNLQTFPNNQTFLEWSRANGYPESGNWHPLEEAHEKAAEYWLPIYQQAINTHTATTKD